MTFVKTGRIKNKALMRSYHAGRCLVCNQVGCDPAHVKTQGSGGDDTPENIMPLCRRHHTEQHQIGIVTFAEKYYSVLMWLYAHGWEIENRFNRKRIVKKESLSTAQSDQPTSDRSQSNT